MLARLMALGATMALATAALALPPFVADFDRLAKVKKGSAVDKADCAVCHVGTSPALNPYGKDVKRFLGTEKKLTAAVLAKAATLDSDKDKVKNGAEIKAGSLPGDAKSKPGK